MTNSPMRKDHLQTALQHLRTHGLATARELMQALGISQPTLSRVLRQAGDQVVAIGQARARRYAASRDVHGLGSHWPLYRIDAQGRAHRLGTLHALQRDQCHLAAQSMPDWVCGEFADGLFPGLPWFLDDMRPQGFLGRAFARQAATTLGLSPDLSAWDQNDVLKALLLRGTDAPGNFVLGKMALEVALSTTAQVIAAEQRAPAFAEQAHAVLAGDVAGSSAAGEQPKFTACVQGPNGAQHVIVKFTDAITGQPAARRWADLLWAEHMANRVLRDAGIETAETELLMVGDQCMLQSVRFDRIGLHGRRGLITLAALDDAHFGFRDSWDNAAMRLQQSGWISTEDARRIRLCWWFGRLIGNSDMHFGNLAFHLDERCPLRVAPLYDMLPMHYRPSAGGGVHDHPHAPPPPLPEQLETWHHACRLAQTFWQQLQAVSDLSPAFHAIAQEQTEALTALQHRFN